MTRVSYSVDSLAEIERIEIMTRHPLQFLLVNGSLIRPQRTSSAVVSWTTDSSVRFTNVHT